MIIHLQREVWWFFPSNSFKIVYEPLLFLCSRIPNVSLEYNKPNLEPLWRENLPEVTPTDWKTFSKIGAESIPSQPRVLPSKTRVTGPAVTQLLLLKTLSSPSQNPQLAQNLRTYQLPLIPILQFLLATNPLLFRYLYCSSNSLSAADKPLNLFWFKKDSL